MTERIDVRQIVTKVAASPEPQYPAGQVAPGRRISLNFALNLDTGAEIENNFSHPPVSCVVGDGNLMPGFEAVLLGLSAGAELDVVLPAEQAFGPVNEDNIQRFPHYQFPPDLVISKGLMIDFADHSGNSQAGVVESFDARYVTIDFNHPLAGRAVRFRVKLHEVGK